MQLAPTPRTKHNTAIFFIVQTRLKSDVPKITRHEAKVHPFRRFRDFSLGRGEDIDSVGADELQDFFEETPYGTRSWLADARFDGKRAADLIMDASVEFRINPLLLLLRMQVEQGLPVVPNALWTRSV